MAAPGGPHALGTSACRSAERSGAGGTRRERADPPTPPAPGWRGGASAPGWGSGELRATPGAAGREGGSPWPAGCSRLGAPLRPLRPPVASPAPRAPAPSLAPRAFLGRHLFATRSLLRQVCLRACEHSSARLSTLLQPAPPGQHASPVLKRGRCCLAARSGRRRPLRAAANPPSPPPGPPDRRHTHLKLVPRVCGINFPEATSPPEEVDRQLGIYMWVSLQVALEQDGLVRKEADFGRGNFLFFF